MKLATLNANSIRARLPLVLSWVERERPDILCLQETKVQDKDFPVASFEMEGYQVLFRGEKSYNGVAIISRLQLEEIRLSLYGRTDEEARFVRVKSSISSCVGSRTSSPTSRGSIALPSLFWWLGTLT
jgi:exodeoxyribonuclease-3